jgi:hypothetical protein
LKSLDSGLRRNDEKLKFPTFYGTIIVVIPAQAGIHNCLKTLDPRLRGDDRTRTIPDRYYSGEK